jgi:hypothetical protein
MSEGQALLRIALSVLGICALWLIIGIPASAVAFVFGRWCAKLLGWY